LKITGSHALPFAPERSYGLLQDPAVLAEALPGVEKLERTGDGEYAMVMKMALAAFSGAFQGKVRILDPDPPVGYKLQVEGTGKLGFLKGLGDLKFAPAESGGGTLVTYEGEVQIGGMLASAGSRLVDSTSKMMIKKFFERVIELGEAVPASGSLGR
jgi:carbon monoxide dehydrogenase subunit G